LIWWWERTGFTRASASWFSAPKNRFEKYLGFKVAAFEVEGYRPRDELIYVMYTEMRQQVARFAMRGDRTMFLFTFADAEADSTDTKTIRGQKALLREKFGASGWECPQILDAPKSCNDLYFDRVSQIRMDAEDGLWTRGRVALIGDAAFCVSLLAGQGSALAMAPHGAVAGSASALLGTLQFSMGATAGGLISVFSNGTAVPFGSVIAACGVGAFLALRFVAMPADAGRR